MIGQICWSRSTSFWFRTRHDDRVLIRAENPAHSQYTRIFCARQGGSSENVSKTARSNGSCSLHLLAGLAAFEAVANSPTTGLDRGMERLVITRSCLEALTPWFGTAIYEHGFN